jgi:hypothetical protein
MMHPRIGEHFPANAEKREIWLIIIIIIIKSIIIFINPWNVVLPEKLTGPQLVNKFPAFCGNRRFITALARNRHLCIC